MTRTQHHAARGPRLIRWLAWAALLFSSTTALLACGGGVGTGGTGTYSYAATYGPITGFGSIIVGGVRFDESAARVEDDDGASASRDRLKLGMVVAIDSDKPANAPAESSAVASVVRFGSVVVGPVSAVSSAAGSLTVLGQNVQINAATVVDDSLGAWSSLAAGTLIEVHGFVDAGTQRIVATRVEAGNAASPNYKVRGFLADLDATSRRVRIGGATFNVAGLSTSAFAALANGQLVTFKVAKQAEAADRWTVVSTGSGNLERPDSDRDRVDTRGLITAFTSTTRFSVNGLPVDASSASFPDGTAGVVLGARVKVEGKVAGGVLTASKVEIESDARVQSEGVDLRGAIEAVNATNQSFRLRGNTVYYGGGGVRFDNGTATQLTAGRSVRVRGVMSADRTRVDATRIEFTSP